VRFCGDESVLGAPFSVIEYVIRLIEAIVDGDLRL
jgi:aminoglycoside phosphotransferase (APT) family kinase protein